MMMIFVLFPLALLNSMLAASSWLATADTESYIKVTRFQVPSAVRLGDSARLSCAYELGGQSLHAMKLFKDDKEFFRFTPGAASREEQRMAFPVPGVQLDRSRSSERDVWLRNASRTSAGVYKCQVSVEDTFNSISAERRMEVLAGPPAKPARQPQQRHTVQQHQQQQQQSGKTAYGLIPSGGQFHWSAAPSAAAAAPCKSNRAVGPWVLVLLWGAVFVQQLGATIIK